MVTEAQKRIQPLKAMKDKSKILLHEVYVSLQGESTFTGELCTFIRTTACHLRCNYCDTANAFYKGQEKSIEEIVSSVQKLKVPLVEVTGGEPLLQKPVFSLLTKLCDLNFQVLLETSGAVSVKNVDKRVHVILDVKSPGSGEVERNIWNNFLHLGKGDEVKFVIGNQEDYSFAKKTIEEFDLSRRFTVLFSPEAQKIAGHTLANWVIRDRLPVRFQTQLHKTLWGEKPGV